VQINYVANQGQPDLYIIRTTLLNISKINLQYYFHYKYLLKMNHQKLKL